MLRWLIVAIGLVSLTAPGARAGESAPVMSFVYQRDEADVSDYAWRVLHEALNRTSNVYGAYVLSPTAEMHQRPRFLALIHGENGVNVALFPAGTETSDAAVPVRIPVDRGMLGYRVLLIRDADQGKFDAVHGLADLRAFRFGILASWIDASIMRNSGLPVVAGDSYDGLFRMLPAGRFDAFNRSVSEVLQEFAKHRSELPGVGIEPHLLLRYPMANYFWFPNTDEGRRRADRVRMGLSQMIEDGTLEALFREEFTPLINELDLAHRRIVELSNPSVGDKDPPPASPLWYRP